MFCLGEEQVLRALVVTDLASYAAHQSSDEKNISFGAKIKKGRKKVSLEDRQTEASSSSSLSLLAPSFLVVGHLIVLVSRWISLSILFQCSLRCVF